MTWGMERERLNQQKFRISHDIACFQKFLFAIPVGLGSEFGVRLFKFRYEGCAST